MPGRNIRANNRALVGAATLSEQYADFLPADWEYRKIALRGDVFNFARVGVTQERVFLTGRLADDDHSWHFSLSWTAEGKLRFICVTTCGPFGGLGQDVHAGRTDVTFEHASTPEHFEQQFLHLARRPDIANSFFKSLLPAIKEQAVKQGLEPWTIEWHIDFLEKSIERSKVVITLPGHKQPLRERLRRNPVVLEDPNSI